MLHVKKLYNNFFETLRESNFFATFTYMLMEQPHFQEDSLIWY